MRRWVYALILSCAALPVSALPETKLGSSSPVAGDRFGYATAIDGAHAAAGAVYEDSGAQSNAGAAYVFKKASGNWGPPFRLTAPAAAEGDQFGHAVAVAGALVAVGAPNYDGTYTDEGRVFVYRYALTHSPGWHLEQQISSPSLRDDDHFGYSVALAGDTLVVGAYGDDFGSTNGSGAAYVFERSYDSRTGTVNWTESAKLKAGDADPGDSFGLSVAISADEQRILVGAPKDDEVASPDSGAAYVFNRNGLNWAQAAKLTHSDSRGNDQFGRAVAIAGGQALVGAPFWDGPAGTTSNQGAAYTFRYLALGGWLPGATLTAPSTPAPGDRFGYAVSLSDEVALIGAYSHNGPQADTGSVFLWQYIGLGWQYWQQLNASDYASGNLGEPDRFGWSIATDGAEAIIGAFYEDPGGIQDAGAAYVYDLDADGDGYLGLNDAFPMDPNEWADNEGDGIGDNGDTDDDNDGMDDDWEQANGTLPLVADGQADPDMDEYDNLAEYNGASNPQDADSTPVLGSYRFERRAPLLAQPWYFDSVAGIASEPFSGNVFLADQGSGAVLRFNSSGMLISRWGRLGSQPGEFGTILAMARAPAGLLYIADRLGTEIRIQKFTVEGEYIGTVSAPPGSPFAFNEVFTTTPMAVNALGDLYIVNIEEQVVQVFDDQDQYVGQWGGPGGNPGEFTSLKGVAVAPDGQVYTAEADMITGLIGRIQYFDAAGSYLGQWSRYDGNTPADMSPLGIAVADDRVYVNSGAASIYRFTRDGRFLGTRDDLDGDGVAGSDGDLILSMGLGKKGDLLVTQLAHHGLLRLSSAGILLGRWASDGDSPGMFRRPRKIKHGQGSGAALYVLDNQFAPRLQKLNDELGFVAKWEGVDDFALDGRGYLFTVTRDSAGDILRIYDDGGVLQETLAPFDHILHLGFDASDRLFVVERGTPRVTIYDESWDEQDNWPLSGHTSLNSTSAVAVVDDGSSVRVFVDDGTVIKAYEDDGTPLDDIGGSGSAPGRFATPIQQLLAGPEGTLYVSETETDRIHRFASTGTFLGRWHSFALPGEGSTSGVPDNNRPYLAAVDHLERIYITGRNNRVRQFSADGTLLAEFGEAGFGSGQFGSLTEVDLNLPLSVAVDGDGRVTVADVANDRIQVFVDTQLPVNAKAIIVAGSGPYAGNFLWPASAASANQAYNVLRDQGLTPDNIRYLSSDSGLDLTGNGIADVDADASNANLQAAIINWAAADAGTDALYLYLTGHGGYDEAGGQGTFRMGEFEILTGGQLQAWLAQLSIPITLVYDACQSGSFLPLSGAGTKVVTSSDSTEPAYFAGNGAWSFSSVFWDRIRFGADLAQAQRDSELAMAAIGQSPQLDANGNGIPNQEGGEGDYEAATGFYLGSNTLSPTTGLPSVSGVSVLTPQPLNGTSSAIIQAVGVEAPSRINSVRAVVLSPAFAPPSADNPITDLPGFDLAETQPGTYQGSFDGFTQPGVYDVILVAEDVLGNTSTANSISVTVGNPLARRAIIVVGGDNTDPDRAHKVAVAYSAYVALLGQGYGEDDIKYLSGGTGAPSGPGVDEPATRNNLRVAVQNWAAADTQDVLLYLVGRRENAEFMLADGERVSASSLDTWLDSLQAGLPGRLTAVYEGDGAAVFLSRLDGYPQDRIRIASTVSEDAQLTGNNAFSSFFWSHVANGATLKNAYVLARNAQYVANGQQGWLDANGDGSASKEDLVLVQSYSLGQGYLLAGDDPVLSNAGASSADTEASPLAIDLALQNVTTTGSIQRVWAVIAPPGTEPGDSGLPELDLSSGGEGPYTGTWFDPAPAAGDYQVSFYAADSEGVVGSLASDDDSASGNSESDPPIVIHRDTGPDAFEVDDTQESANTITIDADERQFHTIHLESDEDWVRFYGLAGETYTISATISEPANSTVDVDMDLHDDSGALLRGIDYTGGNSGLMAEDETALISPNSDGILWVRLYHDTLSGSQPYTPGPGNGYRLAVTRGGAAFPGFIEGNVYVANGGPPVDCAFLLTSGNSSAMTDGDGGFRITENAGSWSVDTHAPGYNMAQFAPVIVNESATTSLMVEMTAAVGELDTDSDRLVDQCDRDDDNDGLSDSEEQGLATNPLSADSDSDGLGDNDEVNLHHTDPMDMDSDDDGFSDAEEILVHGTDPNDADDKPLNGDTSETPARGNIWKIIIPYLQNQ